jgi:hypothetical protein
MTFSDKLLPVLYWLGPVFGFILRHVTMRPTPQSAAKAQSAKELPMFDFVKMAEDAASAAAMSVISGMVTNPPPGVSADVGGLISQVASLIVAVQQGAPLMTHILPTLQSIAKVAVDLEEKLPPGAVVLGETVQTPSVAS